MSAIAPARLRAAFAPTPSAAPAAKPSRQRHPETPGHGSPRRGAPSRGASGSGAPSRDRLRVVVTAPVAARVPFVILVSAILAAGLVALLMLHTLAAQDAFTLHDLQHKASTLSDAEQQLAIDDQQAAAPSTLAARARALGMVPTGSLTITHRHGEVVAVSRALPPPPKPAPSPSATPSASASASAKASPSAKSSASTGASAKSAPSSKPTSAQTPAPRRTHH